MLFSSCAYVLVEAIRRIGLTGTDLAQAQVTTIRLKLLKIGTVILRNTRRIRLLFSSAYRSSKSKIQVCRAPVHVSPTARQWNRADKGIATYRLRTSKFRRLEIDGDRVWEAPP